MTSNRTPAIRIVTDSAARLSPDWAKTNDVIVLPHHVMLNGQNYREDVDLSEVDLATMATQSRQPFTVRAPEVDEFALSGLTPAPCERVAAPRVAESPAAFECRLHREVAFGEATFVVGEILLGHVADDRLADGRVDPRRLAAVGRLGADGYTVVREVLRIRHYARSGRYDRPAA